MPLRSGQLDSDHRTGGLTSRSRLAVLAGLWAFALPQPLLDLIAKNPQFLSVHQVGPLGTVILVVAAFTVVPLGLWLVIELTARLRKRWGLGLLTLVAILMIAATVRPAVGRIGSLGGWLQVAVALAAGGVAVGLVWKLPRVGRQLGLLGWVPVLFSVVFLSQGGPRSILFPPGHEDHEGPSRAEPLPAGFENTPVVLVVFDSFPTVSLVNRDLEIDDSLCPNLAEFARDAIWFRNTLSISPSTLWAVPAIMTGRYPAPGSSPTLDWHRDNIFTWLGDTHRIHAFESHTLLDPASATRVSLWEKIDLLLSDLAIISQHILLPADLARGVPPVTNDWKDFAGAAGNEDSPHAGARDRLLQDFVEAITPSQPAGCYFLHAVVPHAPLVYLPSGERYSRNGTEPSGQGAQWGLWQDDPWAVIHSHQRHLLQVGYTDRLVGRIVARLKEQGLYDDALVVFTADHGVSFRPGDKRRDRSDTNLGDIMPVPLLIKPPHHRAAIVDDHVVRTVDILPTMAQALGTALTWSTQGRSALDPEFPGIETVAHQEKSSFVEIDPGTVLDQRRASLQIKEQRFGRRPGTESLYMPLRGMQLWGHPVSQSLPRRGGVEVSMLRPSPWLAPDPETGYSPVEFVGFEMGASTLPPHCDYLIAVDGRIRAATRPYQRAENATVATISAMLPEAHLSAGEHLVEVYVADWSGNEPIIQSLGSGAFGGAGINLVTTPLPGLTIGGLYGLNLWGGGPARWTDGQAAFILSGLKELPAGRIRVEIEAASPGGTPLIVTVNGVPVINSYVENKPSSHEATLAGIASYGEVRIGVHSHTFQPSEFDAGSKDERFLGVALRRVEFAADTESSSDPTEAAPPGGDWMLLRPQPDSPATFDGLHRTEDWNGEPTAWSNGQLTIRVPWKGPSKPRYLHLDLASSGPEPNELSLEVNGVPVGRSRLAPGPWLGWADLSGVPPADSLTIRILSDTFVPGARDPHNADSRELGVAFRLLSLIP